MEVQLRPGYGASRTCRCLPSFAGFTPCRAISRRQRTQVPHELALPRSYFNLPGPGKDPTTEGGHSHNMSEMPAHQNRDVANRYRQGNPERLSEELLGDLFVPGAKANNNKHNLQQDC